jgi:hypothetical protein
MGDNEPLKKKHRDKTHKRAKRLLKAIEKHAKDALNHGVPRAIYVQSVADHAAATYDRLRAERQREDDDSG